MNDLPLELLDDILKISYLLWVLKDQPGRPRDKEIVFQLASVNLCWFERITKRQFKKAIWRQLSAYYRKVYEGSVITRTNRRYLLENIEPCEQLINLLSSHKCITENQSEFIKKQSLSRDKNIELLHAMRPLDEKKYSEFIKCLRQTKQNLVARVIENGGVVVKAVIESFHAKSQRSQEIKQLVEKFKDLRDKNKKRTPEIEKLISDLKDDNIEILNCNLDQQAVVWIWCKSQEALENLKHMNQSKHLKNILGRLTKTPATAIKGNRSTSNIGKVNINCEQLTTEVVFRSMFVKFTSTLKVGKGEYVQGVTKLRNSIYVLAYFFGSISSLRVIRVFEDRNPFCLQNKFETKEIKDPLDIASSEKENCLYVTDSEPKCVWKITLETKDEDDSLKVVKWLNAVEPPFTLSVSSDGQLLMVNYSSSTLNIYGPDADLRFSLQLNKDIIKPRRAVKTSTGNFIISHELRKVKRKRIGLIGGGNREEKKARKDIKRHRHAREESGSNGEVKMEAEEEKQEECEEMKARKECEAVDTLRCLDSFNPKTVKKQRSEIIGGGNLEEMEAEKADEEEEEMDIMRRWNSVNHAMRKYFKMESRLSGEVKTEAEEEKQEECEEMKARNEWELVDMLRHIDSFTPEMLKRISKKSGSSGEGDGEEMEAIKDIKRPRHPRRESGLSEVKTEAEEEKQEEYEEMEARNDDWVLSELSGDGKTIIRRFLPQTEEQKLSLPIFSSCYLSLDSDDQVFVGDGIGSGRVILLDFDLNWNRILLATTLKQEEGKLIHNPCYDEENNQLIVGGGREVNVYTLNLK